MFLRRGRFCNKTFIDKEMWVNDCGSLSEKFPHVNNILAETGGRQFRVCTGCCETLLGMDKKFDIFLGYLTKTQYKRYSDHAQQSIAINNDGYAVVPFEFKHPKRVVLEYIEKNKSNALASGSINRNNRRKWSNFQTHVGKSKKIEKYREKISELMKFIITPDIAFGAEALGNDALRDGVEDLKAKLQDNIFSVKGECALWRLHGLNEHQCPHVDAKHGSYNVVVPYTPNYKIRVWKGSHHLPLKNDEKKQHICGRGGETVTANVGEIILFHSNVIHCGGASCNKKSNTMRLFKSPRHKPLLKKIKWIGGKHAVTKECITDVSMHFTIDYKFGISSEGAYSAGGRIEIFTPTIDKCSGGLADEACYRDEYRKELKMARVTFEEKRRISGQFSFNTNLTKPKGSRLKDPMKMYEVPCVQIMSSFERMLNPPIERRSTRLAVKGGTT